jgi:putative peptidoglycan lipid II flippase
MWVFSGTFVSRIFGFARVLVIGYTLGYTRFNDSYQLANEIPNIMYELILGSLVSSTLVPFFVAQYKKKNEYADRSLMTFVVIGSFILTAITMLLSPFLAKYMTILNSSGSGHAQTKLVLFFLLFLVPQIFFYAITSAMQAYLSARARFIAAAYVPIVNNVIVIAILLYLNAQKHTLQRAINELSHSTTSVILAIGTTGGVVAITALLAIAYVRAGGSFKPASIKNQYVSALLSRSKWMVLYAIANQIALFIIIPMTNDYPGGVFIYLTAWLYFQLPHGLIANTVMTTMIPRISHTIEQGEKAHDVKTSSDTLKITRQTATGMTVIMTSLAAIGIAIAVPALSILLAHGKVTVSEAEHTGRVLIGFLCFLPAFSLYLFVVYMANVVHKTKLIFYINVAQNIIDLLLAFTLRQHFGIAGITFAFSASYMIVIPFSLHVISKELRGYILERITVAIMAIVSIIGAVIGYFISTHIDHRALAIGAAICACLAIQALGAATIKSRLFALARLVYGRNKQGIDVA